MRNQQYTAEKSNNETSSFDFAKEEKTHQEDAVQS